MRGRVASGKAALFLLCATASCALLSEERREARKQPNIVLVVADDLGWGDLGCYGQEKISTPALDQMAAEGMRFTDFYAGCTVCAPSRSVLMTGKHMGHTYIRGNGGKPLPDEEVTVAEVLQEAGYATGGFGKWGLGLAGSEGVPTKQGFDEFFGFLSQVHAHNHYPTFLLDGEERVELSNVVPNEGRHGQGKASEKNEYATDLIFERARAFIREQADGPFFCFLPITVPHANNEAGKEGMEVPSYGQYADRDWGDPMKGYAAMVSNIDAEVGSILELLRELGLEEDTLVLFTSDNGSHSEGGYNPNFFDSNGPLRGNKRSLHDGGIRVPLIARWPGVVPAGVESDHISYFGDFFETAAELAGAGPSAGLDSVSMLPELRGEPDAQRAHENLYWQFHEWKGAEAVRFGRWKAIRNPIHSGELRLYDLEVDIHEWKDLAAEQPEVAARAASLMASSHTPSEHPMWLLKHEKEAREG
ncbi:MAG: arylsulfatase [Planctomycetes bacterium]|nr:arylsulfatase [Planctomycetota bacterium]